MNDERQKHFLIDTLRVMAVIVLLFCTSSATIRAQASDQRLMTDAEYKAFLIQIESELPTWEAQLKNIDPGKDPHVSYAVGSVIVTERDLGLMQIDSLRSFVASQQHKRSVYGELSLFNFLQNLYDSMDTIVGAEAIGNVTLSNLEKYAPAVSVLQARLGNDAMARVALLEKGTCP